MTDSHLESRGILKNDLLLVDTSLSPSTTALVVAVIDGERRVGVFRISQDHPFLETDAGSTALDSSCVYWGTVTASLRELA